MSNFYNYDTRGPSAASQIITLERMLSDSEDRAYQLEQENKILCEILARLGYDVPQK